MSPDEYYTYEDRAYLNPTLSRDEQLGFVDALRDTIGANTAKINSQTQKLGTDITPNYGGLTGSNSYFKQRYQTTPLEAQVNTLRATAQAKALNDLLSNYQNQAANKYNQAYRNARARAAAAAGSGGGGTGDGGYEQGEGTTTIGNRAYTLDTSKYAGKTVNGQPVNITATPIDGGQYIEEKDQYGNVWDVYKWSSAANKYVRVSGNDGQYQLMPDNFYHSTSSNAYRSYKSASDFANGVTDLGELLLAPGYFIGKKIGDLFAGKRTTTYE